MSACVRVLVSMLLVLCGAAMVSAAPVTVTRDGWTVTADAARGVLSVSHERLGVVLSDLRLAVRDEGGRVQPWASWSDAAVHGDQLTVKTTAPATTWLIEPLGEALRISSTSTRGLAIGTAPAPADRVVARLIDPSGTPVTWSGTGEVHAGYGGSYTQHPSFLPSRNAEVMYFSLGQTAADTLHALFDCRSDTAIRFSDDTRLVRDPATPDRLGVTMPVPGNTVVRLHPDYFGKTLGVPFYTRFDDSRFSRPPTIWCSWTAYYADVTEAEMVRNTDWLAEHLKPYGMDYVQLDDGYDRGPKGEHYWIEKWDQAKFPHGPAWLTAYIKSKGMHPGLWLVPNAYAGAVEEHPDWYVRDKSGAILRDYNTPTLDSTHPGVQDFLKRMFATLRGWGFEYFKFDGEHAFPQYVPAVDHSRLHDPAIDPLVAYRQRTALIREAIGPDTFVEGCPAGTPLNAIGLYNSFFNGDDVYNSWPGMYAFFSSINANAFWNHMVGYVMPAEGIDVGLPMTEAEAAAKRPKEFVEVGRSREGTLTGFGVTLAEAHTLTTYASLTGVAYSMSSVMPELPAERVALLEKTLPPLPIMPIDFFSRGTDMRWDRFRDVRPDDYIHNYPEVLDLKVNAVSGVYDVVGLTNWRGERLRKTVSFSEALGLSRGHRYVAFDFWNERLLGVVSDTIRARRRTARHARRPPAPAGGTPAVGRDVAAHQRRRVDRGSRVGRGDPRPARHLAAGGGEGVRAVRARAGRYCRVERPCGMRRGQAVATRTVKTGALLAVRFTGTTGPATWRITFGGGAPVR